jgi:uncharacterized protein involved in outer membrane biogenesis
MAKKVLVAALAVVVLVGAGVALWARSVLTGDAVRQAVAGQLSAALGKPVAIGSLSASIFPRVSMDLADVTIDQPARVTIGRLRVGTSLGALLSRRIEQATLHVDRARIELPLRLDVSTRSSDAAAGGEPPVRLVSVDEIEFSGVEIVSGGRTLAGDAALRWQNGQISIDRADLRAGDATVHVAGTITSLDGPTGELKVTSEALDALGLVEFFSTFAEGASADAGAGAPTAATAPPDAARAAAASPLNLTVAIEAGRATFGGLAIEGLTSRARVTTDAIRLDPIDFRVFGGSSAGSLTFVPGQTPTIALVAALKDVDVAEAMTFAGSPDTITGRASGRIDVTARGVTATEIARTASGTARLEMTDGTVKGIGYVRQAVLVGSMRADSQAQAASGDRGTDAFSRMGLSAAIGGGTARTTDLQFESPDVLLHAAGVVQLVDATVDLAGDVQLSEALSKSAGRDLVRYTQTGGRVTLPVSVSGPLAALRVRVDVADATKRALTNRAAEEAKKALSKTLGRIIK